MKYFSDDLEAFTAAADSYDDAKFAKLDEAAAAELEVQKGQIVLLKQFDEGRVEYDGDSTSDDLVKFIKLESMPLVNEFNEETAPKIFGGEIMQHLLLFAAKSGEDKAPMGKLEDLYAIFVSPCRIKLYDAVF